MPCLECEGPVPPLKCPRCGTAQRVDRTSTVWETAFLSAWQNTSLSQADHGTRLDVCAQMADAAIWALREVKAGSLRPLFPEAGVWGEGLEVPEALKPAQQSLYRLWRGLQESNPNAMAFYHAQLLRVLGEMPSEAIDYRIVRAREQLLHTTPNDITAGVLATIEIFIFGGRLPPERRSQQVKLTPAALEPVYEAFTELRQSFTGPDPRPDTHISRQRVLYTLESLRDGETPTSRAGRRIMGQTPAEELTLELVDSSEYVVFGKAGVARRATAKSRQRLKRAVWPVLPTMDIKAAILRAIGDMTQEQAMGVYNALAQWAENTSVGLEESSEQDDPMFAVEAAAIEPANAVVAACEAEMAAWVARQPS